MPFEAVIGLEVHAQLKTRTKIFCGCSTEFGAPPNTHTCPVCLGMPGTLPVLNRKVVDFAIKTALATHCRVNPKSRFARKNYFYPDLPKNYQISQYEQPIAEDGYLEIDVAGQTRRVGLTRIHMEEDAGKLIHDPDRPVSRVDYNRTGVPLMEIVSEPDLRSPEEAGAYLRQLRAIVRYIGVCDGNMEEGSFRCDANISLRPEGSETLGTRTEVKNMNSFRNVERALRFEIDRQREILSEGGRIVQETRLWDPGRNHTWAMRGKEEAHDYRYLPDPDLLPLVIDSEWVASIKAKLPELPRAKKRRFVNELKLTEEDARRLVSKKAVADYFEDALKECDNARLVGNWILVDLLGFLNSNDQTIESSPISAGQVGKLVQMIETGRISGKIAKTVFAEMAVTGRPPEMIVKARGLEQVSDSGAIEAEVQKVLAANPDQAAQYRAGKTRVLGFLVGQVMRATRGRANPRAVNEILKERLNKG